MVDTGRMAATPPAGPMQLPATWDEPRMIAELEARAAREGLSNVEAAVMDAGALELADRSFDVSAAWGEAHARLLDVVRRTVPAGGAELGAEAILTRGTR